MNFVNWWDAVENRPSITSLYSVPPELTNVRIMRVALDEDGPTLLVKLELPVFPDKPPLRWQRHQYNGAILELRLFGASELRLSGWTNKNVGTVTLVREGGAVRLGIVGPGVLLDAHGLAADVARIEGFHRGVA